MIWNMNQYNDCIYGHFSDQLMLYSHVLRPKTLCAVVRKVPDSKIHGANMGPTWVLWPQMGPMLAPWTLLSGVSLFLSVDVFPVE